MAINDRNEIRKQQLNFYYDLSIHAMDSPLKSRLKAFCGSILCFAYDNNALLLIFNSMVKIQTPPGG